MKMWLIGSDLWGIVDGSDVLSETANDEDRRKFKKRDNKALSDICLSVSNSNQIYVRSAKNAKEAWDNLESHFEEKTLAKKIYYRTQLYSTKMHKGITMVAHVNKLKTISEHLEALKDAPAEKDLVMILISSLPREYNNLITSLETLKEEELTWNYVRDRVINEYERKKADVKPREKEDALFSGKPGNGKGNRDKKGQGKGNKEGGGKSNIKCYLCHEKGHIKKDCPKLKSSDGSEKRDSASFCKSGNEDEDFEIALQVSCSALLLANSSEDGEKSEVSQNEDSEVYFEFSSINSEVYFGQENSESRNDEEFEAELDDHEDPNSGKHDFKVSTWLENFENEIEESDFIIANYEDKELVVLEANNKENFEVKVLQEASENNGEISFSVNHSEVELNNSEAKVNESEIKFNDTEAEIGIIKAGNKIKNSEVKFDDSEADAEIEVLRFESKTKNSEVGVENFAVKVEDSEVKTEVTNFEVDIKDSEVKPQDSEIKIKDSEVKIQDELEASDYEVKVQDSEVSFEDSEVKIEDINFEAKGNDSEVNLQDSEVNVQDSEVIIGDSEAKMKVSGVSSSNFNVTSQELVLNEVIEETSVGISEIALIASSGGGNDSTFSRNISSSFEICSEIAAPVSSEDIADVPCVPSEVVRYEVCSLFPEECALQAGDEPDAVDPWWLDSGASCHMTGDKNDFISYQKETPGVVTLADKSQIASVGVGDVKAEIFSGVDGATIPVMFKNVLYVPGLKRRLLSIAAFTETGATVIFRGELCTIVINDKSYDLGHKHGKLWKLNNVATCCSAKSSHDLNSLSLWHLRFGHLNKSDVKTLQSEQLVDGISLKMSKHLLRLKVTHFVHSASKIGSK